jgi:serine protease AprX
MCLASLVWCDPSFAQGARLSADLIQQIAANASAIDVIVHGSEPEVAALAARHAVPVIRYLRMGGVLRVSAQQLLALQADGSQDHLSGDVLIHSTASVESQTMLADQVWAGSDLLPPLTGAGVGIALIDSGVDSRHETLWERVALSVDFTGGDGVDRFGHGTHVAGIMAGSQAWLPDGREFRGIAPGAHIVSLRVLDETGSGRASNMIEAIDWAVENRVRHGIRIINLSLGTPVLQPYRDDPLCEAVERAVGAGILVVASAGNWGVTQDGRPIVGGISSPANHPAAVAVGAIDTQETPARLDDTVAPYSSRGPTIYDLVAKPDLVAPGAAVLSAEPAAALLVGLNPEAHVFGEDDHGYFQLTGTSMAAALVSGAAALLLELAPELAPATVKALLQATSTPMAEGPFAGGAGSADVLGAATLLQAVLKSIR